jgi:hypothetical protein
MYGPLSRKKIEVIMYAWNLPPTRCKSKNLNFCFVFLSFFLTLRLKLL